MSTYQDLQLPLKHKALRWLSVASRFLCGLALLLPVYALGVDSSLHDSKVGFYIMGIHVGIFVVAQWISLECRAVVTHIELYSWQQGHAGRDDGYPDVVYMIPWITGLLACLSLLILL